MECPNCNNVIDEKDAFCSNCGQKKDAFHRPFWQLISESFFELFDIDGRLASTLKTLLFKPGYISKAYREGKRARYTPPLGLYLVTSVILFFIMSMIKTDFEGDQDLVGFLLLPTGVLESIPKVMIALLPVYALVIQLSQRKSQYVFNLVFSVHMHTFWYFLLMLFLLLQVLIVDLPALIYVAGVILFYLLVYQVLAIRCFFQTSWLRGLVVNVFTIGIYLGAAALSLEIVATIRQEI